MSSTRRRRTACTFLPIWIEPAVRGIAPSYEQANVPAEAKRGRLAPIAGPRGAGDAVMMHQDATLYATILAGDERVAHVVALGRRAYVHVVRGDLTVNGVEPAAGDAAMLDNESRITLDHGGMERAEAEVLLFDLP